MSLIYIAMELECWINQGKLLETRMNIGFTGNTIHRTPIDAPFERVADFPAGSSVQR